MSARVSVLVVLLALGAASPVAAQAGLTGATLGIGATPTPPDTSTTVRISGLASSGTGQPLWSESDGDVFRRAIAKGDLPAVTVFTDQANTWGAFLQTFGGALAGTSATFFSTFGVTGLSTLTGGFSAGANSSVTGTLDVSGLSTLTGGFTAGAASTVNANLTVGGANDLIVGTGGIRAGSGSIIFRNVADSSTSATIGDSSIALSRNTAVTGTFSATGNATLTLDLAVNGGDITSTAANLNLTPAASLTLNGQTRLAASHTLQSDHFASRATGWGITYAGEADFRYTYADEFYTKNFIADLETALNGGQIIAKSTVVLAQAFTCPAAAGTATLWVRDFPGHGNMRVFAANDWVVLRAMTRADADNDGNIEVSIGDCVGQVSAYTDGTSGTEGTQSWTFTRGSGGNAGAMAASTVVAVDALAIDYGVSGQGFLVARANDGTEGDQSPYWQAVTWTTAPVAANMRLQTRWGNLNGAYGYSTATYGLCAGDAMSVFLCAEPTNGLRILQGGSNQKVRVDPSGYVLLGQTGTGEANAYLDNTKATLRRGLVEGVTLTSAGIELFDGSGVRRIFMDGPSGNLMLGRDGAGEENLLITPTYATFRVAGVSTLYMDGTNGIAVGEVASGKNNVLIDTAGNLSLRTNTTAKISMAASTGDMTLSGNLTVGTGGRLASGATGYGTGTGYWFEYNSGTPRFYIGNGTSSTSEYITWSGSALTVAGALIARGGLTIQTNTGAGAAINTGTLSDLRIQNSTTLGTITLLASGGLNVWKDGATNGSGFTGTKTVRASGGAADCTLIYVMGVLTGGTC